ncbi:alkyl/aryl-sulfatase [Mycobacteroides chelonae]|uniref:Linear primary-alkylsulfatase n=1 Tax=Mycobacteroides chelonae TaxID=1774 RepID=A0A1S1LYK5_MYCCH|nr:alkyl sulfatase dimerization domain-containing protein [Mycobacteroides chelonae]OHU77884.1 alkyl/aryl-sulfatase [Mycobacteroides chelonae]QQG86943.1 MBL fold metallo-hydrolase [Mycobacteroides chelonae]QQG91759.1 MBL fold metallo-hydrolase [Mycobacteroides chelonae]
MEQTQPTSRIIEQNVAAAQELPFANTADQDDADRGFIAALEPGIVTDDSGKTVWDNDSYGFLRDSCPASVHPSLWRQCGLNIRQGLYLVTEGIYQVRGLDISNMTLVEGERGVIVIDPLVSAETAAAALALYRSHRGDRPVTGLIYTHSHADHFGGALGVVSAEDVEAGHCPVLAPAGFLEHAVAENVYAGTAMTRRAVYMYGAVLPRGPLGQVGSGLGQTNSIGTVTLIPPTLDITHTGQEETIDGVRMVFQLTPGTEAPAEMNFHFPQRRALCMAENATHTLHNLLTLRGALVRDPHVWARYITEAINLYARASDVVFASHHWPTWGTELLVEYLALQRDLYAYLHDQTLRQLNQGLVGSEIAESLQLPPALANAWHARGYYGSVSHNVKAIYQRYMGWFDGNPAHLWEHPPVANAQRHVEFMGGAEEVLRKARIAFEEGDYRWVAQVVNYVIFADPANEAAKALQASCFQQLGYGSENATWRNFYLMGAYELSHGNVGTPITVGSPSVVAALTVDQVFDALSLRINGPKAWDERFVSDWRFTDEDRVHRVELRNGVLVHYDRPADISEADVTFTLTRPILIKVLLDGTDPAQLVASGEITVDGDVTGFARLVAVLDQPDPNFAIVTP